MNPDIPAELRRITERCLAKATQDRYASTRDLARDLRDAPEHWAAAAFGRRSAPLRRCRRIDRNLARDVVP